MLKLAQESLGNVGGNVATAGSLADLGGEPPRDGGGQLLGTGRLAHAPILPVVGSAAVADSIQASGRSAGRSRRGTAIKRAVPGWSPSRGTRPRDRDLPSSGISAQPAAYTGIATWPRIATAARPTRVAVTSVPR